MSFLGNKSKKVDDLENSYETGGEYWVKDLNLKLNKKISYSKLSFYVNLFLDKGGEK